MGTWFLGCSLVLIPELVQRFMQPRNHPVRFQSLLTSTCWRRTRCRACCARGHTGSRPQQSRSSASGQAKKVTR